MTPPDPRGSRAPTTRSRPGFFPREYLEVLAEAPEFRRIFLARYASLFGDWFNLLAVLSLLRELGIDDARGIGAVIILKLLPAAIAGPIAGIVADRASRKAVMIVTDALRFGFVLSLFAAPALGPTWGAWLVYGATFLQITAQAFAEPARLAAIPNTVPPRLLGAANALGAVTWSLTFTVGAAIGGIVTSAFGWRLALALDAATYLASIAILIPLRLPATPSDDGSAARTRAGIGDLHEAVRFVRGHRPVALAMAAKTLWGVGGAVTLLLTLYGERVFRIAGSPDAGIALLYMARGLGTALGPILARWHYGDADGPMRRGIGAALLVAALGYAALSWAKFPALAALVVVVAHLGGSTLWVFSTLLLQRSVPDGLRGRVFAAELGFATLAISGSTWVYGMLLDGGALDLDEAARLLAGTLIAAAALWFALAKWVSRGARRGE